MPPEGRFLIKNCSFGYEKQKILNNINLEILPKQIFALVGKSGVGKTTLCKLLVRFYDPQEGEILLDGMNLKDISIFSLKKSVLLTLQNDYVFNGTIWENITYGVESVEEKKVLKAVEKSGLDFIDRFPQGYHTKIGVDGMNISGGEAQRIALARAFLLSPKVFILDEPTSFIDAKTEEKIKESLLKLKEESTIIIIAHRLSTVMIADKVGVMDMGKIVEMENPKELLEKDSFFRKMHSSILK
ncbi:MAG: ATP-binding cassette domain-containing protein [bacterium]